MHQKLQLSVDAETTQQFENSGTLKNVTKLCLFYVNIALLMNTL